MSKGIAKMKELLEMAAEEMDTGNRMAGENLWFSVCRDMLEKLEELEQRVEELEERLEDLKEGRQ